MKQSLIDGDIIFIDNFIAWTLTELKISLLCKALRDLLKVQVEVIQRINSCVTFAFTNTSEHKVSKDELIKFILNKK
jgi:hypothetical protein